MFVLPSSVLLARLLRIAAALQCVAGKEARLSLAIPLEQIVIPILHYLPGERLGGRLLEKKQYL